MKPQHLLLVLVRIVAAIILLQTLYFKFTGQPESIYIFTQVGMEPWGRYLIGMLELAAAILLLIPSTQGVGGLLGAGLMSGAIFFHLFVLGIEVQGDGGYLFFLALAVFAACIFVAWMSRKNIPIIKNILK